MMGLGRAGLLILVVRPIGASFAVGDRMAGFPLIIEPDPEDVDAAQVLVDAILDGRPYRFLLDTGAARTAVQLDEYTSTFGSVGTHTSSGVFAQVSEELILVPSIELGPIAKQNMPVVRIASSGAVLGNLIGMDLLKDVCCHVLFEEQRVEVDPPEEPGISDTVQALFLDSVGHPYVDVQFDSVIAHAVWDTGAGITIADLTFITKHPDLFQLRGQSTGTDATGFSRETPTFMMGASVIGTKPFPPHTVAGVDLSRVNATIDAPMDLILGYSTLRRANWLFDFPRQRWAVTKVLNGD